MFYSNSGNFFGKNRLLFFLFFAFGALFYFVSYFMVFNGQGKRVASNIEFGYKKAQQSFDSHIKRIETLVSSGSTAALFENEWLSQTPEELGFVVMVREGDSLVYWNSSMVSLPDFQVHSTNPLDTLMHLNNGYYQIYISHNDRFEISLLSLVYSDYAYENTYLENKFSERFNSESNRFKLQTEISGEYVIHNLKGIPVFSITEDKDKPTTIISYIYNLLLLVIWITLINILLLNYMRYIFRSAVHPVKRIVTFFVSLIFVRLLLEFSNKLLGLNESDLFNASYFSFGFLFPSIGDLILNIQTLLFMAIAFAKYGRVEKSKVIRRNTFMAGSLVFAIILVVYLNFFFVEQILYHSSIALSFSALYNFEVLSYLLLIVLVLITLSFFLVIYRLSVLLFQVTDNYKILSIIILIQCVVIQLVINPISDFGFLPTIFLLAYFLLAMYNRSKSTMQNRYVFFVLVIGLFSILLTSLFYQVNQHKSDNEQMLTAYKLGLEKDPMFEFLYADMAAKIAVDTTVSRMMDEANPELSDEDATIVNYLKKKYFTGYFERYVIEATVCGQFEDLNIQPDNYVINCNKYFTGTIESSGTETDYPGLFYMEDNEQGTYYISQIVIPQRNGISATIFIEFYFKYIPEGLGYPELLVDERKGFSGDFSGFSFAKYRGEILVYKFGEYLYPSRLNEAGVTENKFSESGDYRHFTYKIDNNKTLIVSRPVKSFGDIAAPFSVFFFLLMLVSVLIYIIIFKRPGELRMAVNFRLKLQMFIFATLTLSFTIIGITSMAYIREVYKQKNIDFLNERTQSILIELEHKLKNDRIDNPEIQEYLHQLLLKFSLIFFSDINLYATDGHLLGSSRPEIFDNGLVSRNMNQEAFRMMRFKRSLFFLQQEQIGKGTYYSSYIPFRDASGNPSAYVNLPYFARETELRDEISGFVLAYINIFLVLTAISVAFALVLSRRLTQPLLMIQNKMKTVRIGKVNEKILWNSKDELGQLVGQYNQLVDELTLSAGLLARSERETAWREMAQQVAHEIKNPLTPMRLSVQYLQRAWDEKDPNIGDKLNRTSRTLVEQIDTLSEIASAFSDFAKMPVNKPDQIDLFVVLQNVVTLFENETHTKIKLVNKTTGETTVFADTKNLNRAFNNLIKNSIQAIGNKADGFVEVTLDTVKGYFRVSIRDNGIGMSEAEKEKIFTPKFTTKSSGMGIGLSIVHNIISAANGNITFESGQGKGTVFTILLPMLK